MVMMTRYPDLGFDLESGLSGGNHGYTKRQTDGPTEARKDNTKSVIIAFVVVAFTGSRSKNPSTLTVRCHHALTVPLHTSRRLLPRPAVVCRSRPEIEGKADTTSHHIWTTIDTHLLLAHPLTPPHQPPLLLADQSAHTSPTRAATPTNRRIVTHTVTRGPTSTTVEHTHRLPSRSFVEPPRTPPSSRVETHSTIAALSSSFTSSARRHFIREHSRGKCRARLVSARKTLQLE